MQEYEVNEATALEWIQLRLLKGCQFQRFGLNKKNCYHLYV